VLSSVDVMLPERGIADVRSLVREDHVVEYLERLKPELNVSLFAEETQ